MFKQWKSNKGSLMVEILVAVAVIGFALVAFLSLAAFSLKISNFVQRNTLATDLCQEAIEGARNFRDGTIWGTTGIGALTPGTDYHPQKTADIPPKWTLVSGEETMGNLKRKIVFENAMRDAGGNIVFSGGANDPDTKKVTATVSWGDKKVEIITYFTNWK